MPRKPAQGPIRRALEESIEGLALGKEHRALVELARKNADEVDRMDEYDDKALRECRMAFLALMEAGSGGVDELAAEVDQLRAKVGNT